MSLITPHPQAHLLAHRFAQAQRLLPLGAYKEVPSYWHEATDFINTHAADTRTLIYPEASFARQTWGWTRDEPAQPLQARTLAGRNAGTAGRDIDAGQHLQRCPGKGAHRGI